MEALPPQSADKHVMHRSEHSCISHVSAKDFSSAATLKKAMMLYSNVFYIKHICLYYNDFKWPYFYFLRGTKFLKVCRLLQLQLFSTTCVGNILRSGFSSSASAAGCLSGCEATSEPPTAAAPLPRSALLLLASCQR